MRRALAAFGLAITFVLALVAGVALHLDLPPVRRAIVARVNGVLATVVAGRITIERLEGLSLGGVSGARVRVDDPSGAPVLLADGVRAQVATARLVRSLLGGGPIVVALDLAGADAVDARVDADALRGTFAPRGGEASSAGGRDVALTITRLSVGHAWVHGSPAPGAPAIDADVDEARGALDVAPPRVAVDLPHFVLALRTFPGAHGEGELHLSLPSKGSASWRGDIAGIDATASASIDGARVDASIDAPMMTAEAIRALWPASPLDHAASAQVEVHGDLPALDVKARTALEGASVDVSGRVTVGDELRAQLHVDAKAVDVHTIEASAPTSSLDGAGDVSLARHPDGALDAEVGLDFAGGPIGGRRAPATRIDATVTRDAAGVLRGEARLLSRDPALPGRVVLRATPKGRSFAVAFDATAEAPRLDGVGWLGPVARGRAKVAARGTLDLDRATVEAHARVTADALERGGARADHVAVEGDVRGRLTAPSIDAVAEAEGVDVGGTRVASARLETHGPLARAHASLALRGGDLPDLEAESDVSLGAAARFRDLEVRLTKAGVDVRADAEEVKLSGGSLRIDEAEIRGVGAPFRLTMDASAETVHLRARARHIDLGRLARLAGVGDVVRRGHLGLDADLAIERRGAASGHVGLDVARAEVGGLQGVAAHLDAQLDGRTVDGAFRAEVGDAVVLELTTQRLRIPGTEPIMRSWRRASGRLNVDGRVALAKILAALPPGALPVDASGEVVVHGRAWRTAAEDPSLGLLLDVKTSGLRVAGRPKAPGAAAPWVLEGVDLGLDARVDGATGFADIFTHADDRQGRLAQLDVKADAIPYAKLVGAADERSAALRALVFNAQVQIPRREVSGFPPLLQVDGADGELEAKLDLRGPVDHLVADGSLDIDQGRLEASGLTRPLDLDATLHYDGAEATTQLTVSNKKGRALAQGAIVVDAAVADWLDHPDGFRWSGAAHGHLESFPLGSIGALSDRLVKGAVTGDLLVLGLHEDARASLSLDLANGQVGDVAFKAGTLRATVDGHTLDVGVHLDQEDGDLDGKAHAGSRWGAALAPTLDPQAPLEASLSAKRFRAATFLPLVDSYLTQLDGRIDADAKVKLDPRTRGTSLSGAVTLTEGRLELAALGGELHDATATVRFTPDGVVTLEKASARGTSGRVDAAASARFDTHGLYGANARVVIPDGDPLLLSVAGARVGTVDGSVDVAALRDDRRHALDVGVTVPALHVQLPQETARTVQSLGPLEGVRIGHAAGGAFVPIDLDPTKAASAARPEGALTVVVNVALGRDVTVKQPGTLSATLAGNPTVTLTDVIDYGGQIRLVGGQIDVQGKLFDIDSGTISFGGPDPSNPQVVLSASWTAEDGTRVIAQFLGPLKTGKVTLSSDPPGLSPNEILSLLLFGTVDQTQTSEGSGSGDPTLKAGAAAGSVATQPVNRALQQFGVGGIQTRVDTSTENPRPEVEVAIARNLSLQLAVLLPTSVPGMNPDHTMLTVDWRFARAWSLATTLGDSGTSVFDVLWHYRY